MRQHFLALTLTGMPAADYSATVIYQFSIPGKNITENTMSKKKLPYLPYTYLVGWSPEQTGRDYWTYYYGCRYADKCHPEDFWVDYFTSSEVVAEKRIEWGEPIIREIRKCFYDLEPGKDATLIVLTYENRVLSFVNAKDNSWYLNKTNGNGEFSATGMKRYNNGSIIKMFFPGEAPEGWEQCGLPTGKKRYNNGEISSWFTPGEEPDGWEPGMIKTNRPPTKAYNNGQVTKRFKIGEAPDGWAEGFLLREKIYFTDGKINRMYVPGEEPPEFKPGRTCDWLAGKKYFNNGMESKQFLPGTEPDGWVEGFLPTGKLFYTNGVETKLFTPGKEPIGWIEGMASMGYSHYNNGIIQRKFVPGEEPPGFKLGKLPGGGTTGLKFHNNGTENIMVKIGEAPIGFVLGRLPNRKNRKINT